MATGKPIVGYEHGGICEMVEKNVNGYLVQPNNIEALSQAIDKMLNSDYKSMGEKSYLRQSKYFSLNSYIENFDKIYEGA